MTLDDIKTLRKLVVVIPIFPLNIGNLGLEDTLKILLECVYKC